VSGRFRFDIGSGSGIAGPSGRCPVDVDATSSASYRYRFEAVTIFRCLGCYLGSMYDVFNYQLFNCRISPVQGWVVKHLCDV